MDLFQEIFILNYKVMSNKESESEKLIQQLNDLNPDLHLFRRDISQDIIDLDNLKIKIRNKDGNEESISIRSQLPSNLKKILGKNQYNTFIDSERNNNNYEKISKQISDNKKNNENSIIKNIKEEIPKEKIEEDIPKISEEEIKKKVEESREFIEALSMNDNLLDKSKNPNLSIKIKDKINELKKYDIDALKEARDIAIKRDIDERLFKNSGEEEKVEEPGSENLQIKKKVTFEDELKDKEKQTLVQTGVSEILTDLINKLPIPPTYKVPIDIGIAGISSASGYLEKENLIKQEEDFLKRSEHENAPQKNIRSQINELENINTIKGMSKELTKEESSKYNIMDEGEEEKQDIPSSDPLIAGAEIFGSSGASLSDPNNAGTGGYILENSNQYIQDQNFNKRHEEYIKENDNILKKIQSMIDQNDNSNQIYDSNEDFNNLSIEEKNLYNSLFKVGKDKNDIIKFINDKRINDKNFIKDLEYVHENQKKIKENQNFIENINKNIGSASTIYPYQPQNQIEYDDYNNLSQQQRDIYSQIRTENVGITHHEALERIKNITETQLNNSQLSSGIINNSQLSSGVINNPLEVEGVRTSEPSLTDKIIKDFPNKRNNNRIYKPIHKDALGLYFNNAYNPTWQWNLFAFRNSDKYLNFNKIKSYLLMQSSSIVKKYGIQLFVYNLVYGNKSSASDIAKENHEILQLFFKYKGIVINSSNIQSLANGILPQNPQTLSNLKDYYVVNKSQLDNAQNILKGDRYTDLSGVGSSEDSGSPIKPVATKEEVDMRAKDLLVQQMNEGKSTRALDNLNININKGKMNANGSIFRGNPNIFNPQTNSYIATHNTSNKRPSAIVKNPIKNPVGVDQLKYFGQDIPKKKSLFRVMDTSSGCKISNNNKY